MCLLLYVSIEYNYPRGLAKETMNFFESIRLEAYFLPVRTGFFSNSFKKHIIYREDNY